MFGAGLGLIDLGRAAPRAQQLLRALFPGTCPGPPGRAVIRREFANNAMSSSSDSEINLTELLSACVDLGVRAGHEIR